MRSTMRRASHFVAAVGAIAGVSLLEGTQTGASRLPPRLESYLSNVVRPTATERRQLMSGAPVTKLLDFDPSKEVAVFGAVWIDAPMSRYIEVVQDIENFERGGGFRVTKRLSTPPRLEEFNQLHLPADDVADLRSCRVSDCEIKLGQRGLDAFRTEVNWKAGGTQAAAEAVMRRLALDYVTGYLDGGNDRLAVYRDNSRPTFVADEFRSMVDQMPELTTYMPNLRSYLLQYPKVALPDARSFIYWQETVFGLKPTIRISHLTIREGPEDTVVASKMLYASHYFWTALELRTLVPDPGRGRGFWFVTVSRSRSDGLSGFTGLIVRRRVQSEARDGALAALRLTKRKVEQVR